MVAGRKSAPKKPAANPSAEVRAFWEAAPQASHVVLTQLRAAILAAAPAATEGVRRGALAFAHQGRLVELLAVADLCILFVPSAAVMRDHAKQLAGFQVAAGIRFPVGRPVPAALVKSLVRARLAENARRSAKKK